MPRGRDRTEGLSGIRREGLFLTRLIWALAQAFGNKLLLKGGTLLSKVDLGFHRMSEDVDMVMPLVGRANDGPIEREERRSHAGAAGRRAGA